MGVGAEGRLGMGQVGLRENACCLMSFKLNLCSIPFSNYCFFEQILRQALAYKAACKGQICPFPWGEAVK